MFLFKILLEEINEQRNRQKQGDRQTDRQTDDLEERKRHGDISIHYQNEMMAGQGRQLGWLRMDSVNEAERSDPESRCSSLKK